MHCQAGASVTKSPLALTRMSSSVANTGVVCAGRLDMSAASHKYRRFCLVDPRAAHEVGIAAVLEGIPCDGQEVKMPRLCQGVMAVNTRPDGLDGRLDYFCPRTARRDRRGRIIRRYSGAAVRA